MREARPPAGTSFRATLTGARFIHYTGTCAKSATPKGGLRALQIFSVTGVDFDFVARVHEQRHLDGGAGFRDGRLVGTGCGVSLEARFRLRDFEDHECWRLDTDAHVLEEHDLADRVLLAELQRVADARGIQRNLLVGLFIHEVKEISVLIQVLHVATADLRAFKLVGGVEGTLHRGSRDDIADFGADERGTLARLDMLEFNDLEDRPIHLEGHIVPKIARK